MKRPFLFLAALFGAFALPAAAQFPDFGGGSDDEASASGEATLSSEVAAVAPGEPFTVAIEVTHPDTWHSYYRNSGGIELPPEVTWSLPEGFEHGPIQWPVPGVFEGDFGPSIGYSEGPVLLIEITPPADLEPGDEVPLAAGVTWQFCKPGKCINERAELELTLPVAAEAEPNAARADYFAEARAALPTDDDGQWDIAFSRAGSQITLRLTSEDGDAEPGKVSFIPDQAFLEARDFTAPERVDDHWTLKLRQATDIGDEPVPIDAETVSGIVKFAGGPEIQIEDVPFTKAPTPPLGLAALLPVLGGMLLGGLILNLMPCVFPVIGLKIMGFVQQAGEDRKKIILHGLIFALGVLASFWVLSGVLFALRSAAGGGEEIGWGYQLQNPWTILVLLLVMFVLGLAMYGVFEIGTSLTGVGGNLQSKQGVSGSFFSGVLATILATPCSAPFLGAAIGVSMTLPASQFFLAFTFMAIGLALPYLVLSIFPKLIDFLPRPGPWMESFKQAMSFLLFATAGFLLWIYIGQTELSHMLPVVIGLTLIAIAAWVWGRWNTPMRKKPVRITARTLTVVFAGLGLLAAKPPGEQHVEWQTWSPERVEELLAEGTPVFVDFTAQWCATCQVNKAHAYPESVAAIMDERGIVALKADKTNPDPVIEAKLAELGRSAIPVNVLYVPGKDPIITPEILSADYLEELFTEEVPPPDEAPADGENEPG